MTYIAYKGDTIEVDGRKFSLRAELAKIAKGKKSRVDHFTLLTAAHFALQAS